MTHDNVHTCSAHTGRHNVYACVLIPTPVCVTNWACRKTARMPTCANKRAWFVARARSKPLCMAKRHALRIRAGCKCSRRHIITLHMRLLPSEHSPVQHKLLGSSGDPLDVGSAAKNALCERLVRGPIHFCWPASTSIGLSCERQRCFHHCARAAFGGIRRSRWLML